MDAETFLSDIAKRLKQLAAVMFAKYPTVGLTADDFEQEAIISILSRVFKRGVGSRGPSASRRDYDPKESEPWTYAKPVAVGAMIDAALKSARSIEFYSPRQIKRLSEEAAAAMPEEVETTSPADRFAALAASVGVALTPRESQSMQDVFANGEPAASEVHRDSLRRVRDKFRAAAGSRGIAAFAN